MTSLSSLLAVGVLLALVGFKIARSQRYILVEVGSGPGRSGPGLRTGKLAPAREEGHADSKALKRTLRQLVPGSEKKKKRGLRFLGGLLDGIMRVVGDVRVGDIVEAVGTIMAKTNARQGGGGGDYGGGEGPPPEY